MNYCDYRDYNDYELLSYIEENNEEANNIIFKKYEPLIFIVAEKIYKHCNNNGLELNDLIQEGRFGLNVALDNYNSSKNTTFYTYALSCIKNSIMSMSASSRLQKNKILNESISIGFTEDEQCKIKDYIYNNNSSSNPEQQIIEHELEQELTNKIGKVLTKLEKKVFDLRISGFSYQEISRILNKDKKSIDNAMQRIRIKAKNILNS